MKFVRVFCLVNTIFWISVAAYVVNNGSTMWAALIPSAVGIIFALLYVCLEDAR